MTSSTPDSGPVLEPGPRRAVFIVGSGRSGTSALACSLQTLGLHVPQPEVAPDETNPKGFGESQWVVDFHDRLLRKANVGVADGRPSAWFDTGKVATNDRLREEARVWLDGQFTDEVREVVVKDPRLAWFIGLWRSAALRSDVEATYAITLRAPAEVIGSKKTYYSSQVSEVARAASWINQMLHTERATRGSRRGFVRYADLLEDWTVPVYRLGATLGLDGVRSANARNIRRVHELIDPDLHRVRTTWDDVDLPAPLRAIAEETWRLMNRLVDDAEESPEVHAALDDAREAYARLYGEAEALVTASIQAARRQRPPKKKAGASTPAPAPEPAPVEAPAADEPADDAAPSLSSRARGLLGRR
ncbi:sulfotransferase family protein [Nocardioides sp. KIGAM211]|uniref:Sulfotransferase family protein n=1 Tax=Nocardioides luti TaxID=2761101 RepID=A0A7X0VB56_9ACTN|nr:sulfotransferase family protein [Nocardioides luti]MBB6628499.1 sulfotransferase family protein [Nocardioides luti]